MRAFLIFFIFLINASILLAQTDSLPGTLYRGIEKSSFQVLVDEALKADVVFFGEMHDSRTAHRWQLALYRAILKARPQAPLGMEMFEADNQLPVDEYLTGLISEKQFAEAARLWSNYADYKPLVDTARARHCRVIATNVPRRYASLVARMGLSKLDSLPLAARAFMAPLPLKVDYTLPSYQAMAGMGAHDGMPNTNFVDAQALKDATMAHFIAQALDARKDGSKGRPFLHLNGSYHTDGAEGIVPYLLKIKPKAKVLIITTVPVATPQSEWVGKGIFTLMSE